MNLNFIERTMMYFENIFINKIFWEYILDVDRDSKIATIGILYIIETDVFLKVVWSN